VYCDSPRGVSLDGLADLVVSEGGRLRVYPNVGGGLFGEPTEPTLRGAAMLGGVAAADVDKDGKVDVLVTTAAPSGVLTFQNTSATQAP
jgi:hypothetical protein